MVTAFVLVMTKTGQEKGVLEKINKLNSVQDAWSVYGDYDILIKVSTQDIEGLNNFIIKDMRTIQDIAMTTTLIGI